MSDLFHEDLNVQYIVRVFATMYEAQWHTYQVLTKRARRMRELTSEPAFRRGVGAAVWENLSPEKARVVTGDEVIADVAANWPLPNVWLGVSVEDQRRADERIPELLKTPAAVRFLSIEPLLGPIDLRFWDPRNPKSEGQWMASVEGVGVIGMNRPVDWVIVGGESGPGARPMHPDWARSIRDQCAAAGVPFFFKQWGEWADLVAAGRVDLARGSVESHLFSERPYHDDPVVLHRVGKRAAGRILDGRTWDQMPRIAAKGAISR